MEPKNHFVKDNYPDYQTALFSPKVLDRKILILKDEGKNKKWTEDKSTIEINNPKLEGLLRVKCQKYNSHHHFLLFCEYFGENPIFYFDSHGVSHRNRATGLKLNQIAIPTPHFQRYSEDGRRWAYQTDKLKEEDTAKILREDINFSIAYFCDEANMKLIDGNYPSIEIELLDIISSSSLDPTEGLLFD